MRRPLDTAIIRSRDLGFTDPPKASTPLTATAMIYGGPGVGLAEIQSSIAPPSGNKGKILAVGVPRPEIDQILQTVLQFPTLVGRPDYDVCCRMIGAEKWRSTFALALAVAILSSYLGRPIPPDIVFLGELDLHRKLRGGTARLVENLRRSIESGEVDSNIILILPPPLKATCLAQQGVQVFPCNDLLAVISATWELGAQ